MALLGIDVSEYQGDIAFAQVKTSPHAGFVYAKATEGMTMRDAKYHQYHDGAKVNEIPFGAYHFFHFGTSPQAQVENFLAATAGYEGHLLPMVDVESASIPGTGMAAREAVGRLGVFLDILEGRLHGKRALIYTGWDFWNTAMRGSDSFSGHQVWVAAYCSPPAPVPTGWKMATLWQYSSSVSVPGIARPVDGDQLLTGNLLTISRAGV
jgi:GH25 family lysozyme M1 (1,4-beta-N-acetylmuramidase)